MYEKDFLEQVRTQLTVKEDPAKLRQRSFETSSGIPLKNSYTPADIADHDPLRDLGAPGKFPFTRHVQPTGYRGRLWTMRQYAGFATAEESNARYRYLLAQGTTGLSVAFDLPTQIGMDPDHEMALGEVGKVGVSISSIHDMRTLFRDIPLDKVTTSMTINAPAAVLLALYLAVAEEQGVSWAQVGGTIQNDILKEYMARGTYIFPPRQSLRLITDIFAFCADQVPGWNTISISGYHIREAGCTAAQEIAFTLGDGIAYVQARKGIATVLKDVTLEKAEQGKAYSRKLLDKRVEKGGITPQRRDEILGRITPAGDASALAGCELIIEAVFEKRDLKAAVTREAEPYLIDGGIMASNTSTLPITGLAEASTHPSHFIGLHFFSPVDKMPLVEIIKGRQTSPETLARAYDFVTQIGKTPIVVNDSRGFFTSRVFRTFRNEGLGMLAEGLNPAMIENASLQVGMPVGALAVADEVSMALSLSVTRQTIADLAAEGKTYAPHPADAVVEKMVSELNRPGRAGGGGFYEYPANGKKHLWEGLAGHFPQRGSADVPFQDMKDRILYVQALESVRCLEEGVLESTRDANVGSILGIGFPRWTGGVLQFINQVGLDSFIERARELAARYGSRFEPPALLLRMAQEGTTFA